MCIKFSFFFLGFNIDRLRQNLSHQNVSRICSTVIRVGIMQCLIEGMWTDNWPRYSTRAINVRCWWAYSGCPIVLRSHLLAGGCHAVKVKYCTSPEQSLKRLTWGVTETQFLSYVIKYYFSFREYVERKKMNWLVVMGMYKQFWLKLTLWVQIGPQYSDYKKYLSPWNFHFSQQLWVK